MAKTTVTYQGESSVLTSIQIPGWGGSETNNEFQPWHLQQFNVVANAGIELLCPFENVSFFNRCAKPFVHLSDKFYSLDLDFVLSTRKNCHLLVLPHYRYYTDETWSTPLPVACAWESDWWPLPMTIIFRYGPCETKFIKGEPFAQVIPVQSLDVNLIHMDDEESSKKKQNAQHIIDNRDKYTTRKWVMSSGVIQDNLYNVLSLMNKENQLPFSVRAGSKFKIVKSNHD